MAAFVAVAAAPPRGVPTDGRTRRLGPARPAGCVEDVGVVASSFGGERAAGGVWHRPARSVLSMIVEGTFMGDMQGEPVLLGSFLRGRRLVLLC